MSPIDLWYEMAGNLKWVLLSIVVVLALFGFATSWGGGSSGVSAKASHILVNTEAEIDDLYNQLSQTADGSPEQFKLFAELAKKHSKCPSGARGGGALGTFGRGQMVPEFDRVVFEEAVGKIHKVKTQFGWHLVLTTERTEPEDKKDL
ncbi:PpiC-type peptidyl-prolyl cis-trans isomerase [Thraustotheca clavata]|uniref:Peptidyl-prolyl cis-trans isomerase n=1 Tax=Thraustotheca clavata TaxID=74557 RepID=A0A1V9ZVH9_9STRA|nr:PpiC-type peptidyl-prolyl cis-trans isomerase [Thraustotheca clavata]